MRKVLLLVTVILLLTGCGQKENVLTEPRLYTITCKIENVNYDQYTLNSEYKINYYGDYVDNVVTVETVTSDSTEILDYMENYLKQIYTSANETYGGYTYNISKETGKISAMVSINYNIMDLNKFVEGQPAMKNYIEDGKFLVSGIINVYESMGATCDNNASV